MPRPPTVMRRGPRPGDTCSLGEGKGPRRPRPRASIEHDWHITLVKALKALITGCDLKATPQGGLKPCNAYWVVSVSQDFTVTNQGRPLVVTAQSREIRSRKGRPSCRWCMQTLELGIPLQRLKHRVRLAVTARTSIMRQIDTLTPSLLVFLAVFQGASALRLRAPIRA